MCKRWIVMVLMLLTTALSSGACEHKFDEKPVIMVVGDSLSSALGLDVDEGWVALLERRLAAQSMDYQVVNASISGDTTSGGLARLAKALPDLNPAVVVIELGGNDGLRGLSLKSMAKNLEEMMTLTKRQGAQPVLLGMRIPSNYGPRYTEKFHATYAELAEKHGAPLMPFFMEGVALDESLMQSDGIHPNALAQPVLLDNAWPSIKQGLERYCTEQPSP